METRRAEVELGSLLNLLVTMDRQSNGQGREGQGPLRNRKG